MANKEKKDDKIIKKKTRVTVSNTLNQMIFEQKDMNLQAFRMVMFYLAKINPKYPDRTEVKVPLEKYAEMLGVELNEQSIEASTNMLMGYIIKTGRVDMGDYIVLNAKYAFFSTCKLIERKSDGKRILEFKCSDDIKPMIFELKEKFTHFDVWNVLNLSNFQDIRMYMLLAQYKVAGKVTLSLEQLQGKLGIDKGAYPEYKIFARDVLKKCQKSLKERTDICFEFSAVGRPTHSIRFTINKNEDYKMLKNLDDPEEPIVVLDDNQRELVEAVERENRSKICCGFDDEIFDEFTSEQLQELKDIAFHKTDLEVEERHYNVLNDKIMAKEYAIAEYIAQKIRYCNANKKPVPYRNKFIKGAIEGDWK